MKVSTVKNQQVPGRHATIVAPDRIKAIESLPWIPHPKFDGVSLRHLVTGNDTGGRLSLHHVRIDPGKSIGDHAHAGQVETHDVIDGAGTCTLEGYVIPYTPGVIGVMPADKVHRVDAGRDGLLLLATFSPPLV
jgi:quercetin dioxygenase-like cupin family protein